MILDLIRSGDIAYTVIGFCVSLFVVFCILPIHEYAHALIATKLGDTTAKDSGRLTLYPFAHINWLGALMILLVGFGYAQPVPVNVNRVKIKNKKLAMALIALAGPVSNLIFAFVSYFAAYMIAVSGSNSELARILVYFFQYTAIINVNLAVFNLIPIPPLDGSRILFAILPTKYYFKVMQYERYIVLIVMVLLFTGVLSRPLSAVSSLIINSFGEFFEKLAVLFIN